jgi:hypothetical protein
VTTCLIESLLDTPLNGALVASRNGPPLLIRCRHEDTLSRLCRVAETEHYLEVLRVRADGSPLHALLNSVSTDGFAADSLEELVVDAALSDTVLLADGRGSAAAEWRNIAGLFASRRVSKGPRGPTLIIHVDSENTPTGCRFIDDGSLTGPAESLLLAQREQRCVTVVSETANYCAIEAARGDLHLLSRLLRLPDVDKVELEVWCRGQQSNGQAPLLWRGREEFCPVWLAAHDPPRLGHRLWRGQVMSLFPWLEEAREQFIISHGARLPDGEVDRETGDRLVVQEYEWGHIARALKRLNRNDLASHAHILRLARNYIAHGHPLKYREIINAETAFQQLVRAKAL